MVPSLNQVHYPRKPLGSLPMSPRIAALLHRPSDRPLGNTGCENTGAHELDSSDRPIGTGWCCVAQSNAWTRALVHHGMPAICGCGSRPRLCRIVPFPGPLKQRRSISTTCCKHQRARRRDQGIATTWSLATSEPVYHAGPSWKNFSACTIARGEGGLFTPVPLANPMQ